MLRNSKLYWLSLLWLGITGCKMPGEEQRFSKVTEDFVYGSLALSPVAASAAGYHEHHGISLDEKLDDYDRGVGLIRMRFYRTFEDRLQLFKPESLAPEDRADYRLIEDQIKLGTLEFASIHRFRHDPTLYTGLIARALRQPNRRIARIPVLLEQARANLVDSPEVWNKAAQEENEANIALIGETAKPALDEMRRFNAFLKDDLSKRPSSWRLGAQKYELKFKHALDTDKTPREVLAEAEAAFKDTRAVLGTLAAPGTPDTSQNPEARRLLRSVYGSRPYLAGWAVYSQNMSDRQLLRVIGDAILDIRLHTMDMSEQEAIDFMIHQTFRTKEEAAANLRRAQLTSCELPAAFVGWRGWLEASKGHANVAEFQERALKEGAVPLQLLRQLVK